MEMQGLPTASPLQTGQPVYVALVPGVRAEAGHFGVIQSGWTTADAQEIHELSRQVLQLAMVNCVVAVTFRVVALVLMALQGRVTYVVEYAFWIVFAFVVLFLGVQGVKLRNPPLVECCACGHLTAFYSIYIVFSVLAGISVLFCVVTGLWGYFVVNALFLALYSVTADKSRRLLDGERSGTDSAANALAAGRGLRGRAARPPRPTSLVPVARRARSAPRPSSAVVVDAEAPGGAKAAAAAPAI
ncbi:ubiquitin-protein transferase [Aureococcus anophagefferens]|nr:ubiquitin-protein transferase [Aureococcus anophagefferens]